MPRCSLTTATHVVAWSAGMGRAQSGFRPENEGIAGDRDAVPGALVHSRKWPVSMSMVAPSAAAGRTSGSWLPQLAAVARDSHEDVELGGVEPPAHADELVSARMLVTVSSASNGAISGPPRPSGDQTCSGVPTATARRLLRGDRDAVALGLYLVVMRCQSGVQRDE